MIRGFYKLILQIFSPPVKMILAFFRFFGCSVGFFFVKMVILLQNLFMIYKQTFQNLSFSG